MKIGEIWQNRDDGKVLPLIQVKITNIYQSDDIVNRASIAKDQTYVSSKYIVPWNDGSSHADLSREHFLEQYYKIRDCE